LISQKEVLIKWHISEWCSYCRCKTHRSKRPYETIHCRYIVDVMDLVLIPNYLSNSVIMAKGIVTIFTQCLAW